MHADYLYAAAANMRMYAAIMMLEIEGYVYIQYINAAGSG